MSTDNRAALAELLKQLPQLQKAKPGAQSSETWLLGVVVALAGLGASGQLPENVPWGIVLQVMPWLVGYAGIRAAYKLGIAYINSRAAAASASPAKPEGEANA